MRRIRPFMACVLAAAMLLAMPMSLEAATWPDGSPKVDVARGRVYDMDRYSTSVAIAKEAFPGWAGVDHVVIASGEDRAAADPLAAASLCWAYDAPLLLTQASKTPAALTRALKEIVSANTTVTVTVVGGPVSVPYARSWDFEKIVGSAGTVERPWGAGDRFSLAAGIAGRVRQVAIDTSRTIPSAAMVANGANPDTFFDALSAAAISANTGVPVLLSNREKAPPATEAFITSTTPDEVILVGGPATISWSVFHQLKGDDRFHGADRYGTSVAVANGARSRGWSDPTTTYLVGTLPDAVSGAALAAMTDSPILVTSKATLCAPVAGFLASGSVGVTKAVILGGSASVSNAIYGELGGNPGPARFTSFKNLATKQVPVNATTGVNTTQAKLYVDGKLKATKQAKPFSALDFGTVKLAEGTTEIKIVTTNPDGATATVKEKVRTLDYPASTCIIIDKSDFKLYWIKNDKLVKAYPIAHGRVGHDTPERTWKIGAKYYSSGVYGPRKMRLFAKSGSSYTYTAYLIHGTNQEWVIGTRASAGCIRMYNKDVLELYPQVPLGTIVVTRR